MIDVQLNTSTGRTLMSMLLGALKYQAITNQKNQAQLQKEIANINRLEKESNFFEEISFDITSRMIDKRFTESKLFVKSGGGAGSSSRFKQSTTKSDKHLQRIVQQNTLKSRTKYNTAVSSQNKRLAEKKARASFKLIDIKKAL